MRKFRDCINIHFFMLLITKFDVWLSIVGLRAALIRTRTMQSACVFAVFLVALLFRFELYPMSCQFIEVSFWMRRSLEMDGNEGQVMKFYSIIADTLSVSLLLFPLFTCLPGITIFVSLSFFFCILVWNKGFQLNAYLRNIKNVLWRDITFISFKQYMMQEVILG